MTAPGPDHEPRTTAEPGSPSQDVDVLPGTHPGIVSHGTVHALVSVFLAAFMIAAAKLRAQQIEVPFDLLALLLRVLAAAFAVRALIAAGLAVRSLMRARQARRCTLMISPSELRYRDAAQERAAAREDVLSLEVPETRRGLAWVDRQVPLLVVLRPQAQRPRYWTLPPYFTATSEILAARLQRWLAPRPAPQVPLPRPSDGPDQRYEQAAKGRPEPDDVLIPQGTRYLLRAPYAGLLGIFFALDAYRMAGAQRGALLLPIAAACLLCLTFVGGWVLWMKRRLAPGLGLAMLLTPAELLMRTRHGVISVPWEQAAEITLSTKLSWSPFWGSYSVRLMELTTRAGETLRVDGSLMAVPCEVVVALCRAYRAPETRTSPQWRGTRPPSTVGPGPPGSA